MLDEDFADAAEAVPPRDDLMTLKPPHVALGQPPRPSEAGLRSGSQPVARVRRRRLRRPSGLPETLDVGASRVQRMASVILKPEQRFRVCVCVCVSVCLSGRWL